MQHQTIQNLENVAQSRQRPASETECPPPNRQSKSPLGVRDHRGRCWVLAGIQSDPASPTLFFRGRITADGRREFYYYAPRSEQLEAAVEDTIKRFRGYEFDYGWKRDPSWTQYVEILYPSEEDRQRIQNRKVLDVLEQKGDTLQRPRDVWHWIYFRETDREEFRAAVTALQYRVESSPGHNNSEFPNGICIVRFQSVKPSELDDAVIELFRLAKKYCGDYDGWETQVISQ